MKNTTVIATNRFGLGARPGDLGAVDDDPKTWLLDQVQGPSRVPDEIRGLPHSSKILVEMQALRRDERTKKRDAKDESAPDVVKKYGRIARRNYMEQITARYQVAAGSDHPFHERLVHFWSNHFAISIDKQPLPTIAGLFENEAIRPNVTGKFADLLIAAEQHPAMILYLDNARSIGPRSRLGSRANKRNTSRSFGLNENLAREILELHTLGVDGGYTQRDVTTFAEVITGWSIGGMTDDGRFSDGKPGTFEFREIIHEPGPKTVLGRQYSQSDVAQGEAVLRDLAVHPSTARFLATKLARHFVADDPPVHTKYKTPHDFVLSTFRAFDRVPDDARFLTGALDLMAQAPFRPGSPEGWPDTAEQWGGADGLFKRIEWSNTVARVVGSGVNPAELGDTVLGPAMGTATRQSIARAESEVQGLTLLLASPDFQRR
jgi:uncharacterized protein (DUF1800 family)